MPLPLLAVGALINAGVSAGTGIAQLIKGEIMSGRRPTAELSDELKQNLTQAEIGALEGMPEAQRQQAIQLISRNLAGGARMLQDRNQAIGGVSALVQQGNDAALNLAGQDSMFRLQNKNQLYNARRDEANDKIRVWDWNQRQKFLENSGAASAMKGAGIQNLTNAPNQAFSGLVQSDYMNFLKKAYGGGGQPPAPNPYGYMNGMQLSPQANAWQNSGSSWMPPIPPAGSLDNLNDWQMPQ